MPTRGKMTRDGAQDGCAFIRSQCLSIIDFYFPFRSPHPARCLTVLLFVLIILSLHACNPFAPAIDTTANGSHSLLSDGKTIDGIFQNIRYAYTFKDTTIYGSMLENNFVFSYHDYDALKDVSWGRDEEMQITYRLFQNATVLSLIWNNIIGQSEDSLQADVTRSFTLTVTFNPNDIIRVDGRASFKLQRPSSLHAWKITRWNDESNY